jgi:hypothetical protein
MDNKIFYIQISSTSLSHYILRGCILPSVYIENKIPDFQDKAKEGLILSNKKWNKDNDCTIEVIITDDEYNKFNSINSDYYYYNNVIPISRITNIFFLTKEQADTTIWNINNGAGFIPSKLIKLEKNKKTIGSIIRNINNFPNKDLSKKIKSYDLLLGGFAFMKLGTNDPSDDLLNYSENYISTLSYFNDIIKSEFLKSGQKISTKYYPLFNNNQNSDIEHYKKFLGKDINLELLESIAESENFKIETKFGRIKNSSIPINSILYTLSFLASYGSNKEKSIDNFVSDIIKGEINETKIEEITLLFGLNTGYSLLRNSYSSLKHTRKIKFDLENKLDYYTIESIYQYAFNNKTSSNFSFLNHFKFINLTKPEPLFKYFSYKVFDTTIVAKKKDYSEYLDSFSKILFSEVSNWFSNEAIQVNSKIEQKFKELLKPQFISLINDITSDSEKRVEEEMSKIGLLEKELINKTINTSLDKNIEEADPNNQSNNISEKSKSVIEYSFDSLMKLNKEKLQNLAKEKGCSYKKSDTKKILSKLIVANNSSDTLFP